MRSMPTFFCNFPLKILIKFWNYFSMYFRPLILRQDLDFKGHSLHPGLLILWFIIKVHAYTSMDSKSKIIQVSHLTLLSYLMLVSYS